ncbi:MAG TPA: phosphate signaling complex protein PhoU [bacterium]|nr:phosphate signaling complex protein PhoU [bacterium]
MKPLHTDRQFEGDLTTLREKLLLMGAKVEGMIVDALRSLVERDAALARAVIARDGEVDHLEVEIDELALQILALRQPAASDLRFITLAMKINTDLERIGDLATNIAERSYELIAEPALKPYVDLQRLGAAVRTMLRDALDSFVSRDAKRAEEVRARDAEVDQLHAQIFQEVQGMMVKDVDTIRRGTRLLFVSKYLERIADHATNLAEAVVFLVQGRDIRHTPKIDPSQRS